MEFDNIMQELDEYVEDLRRQKDEAYSERNKLVALLSKFLPSYIGRHEESDKDWEEDWMNIIYIYLPNGIQMSWHIHDDELEYFEHLERKDIVWDNSTTEEKYERMRNFINAK